MNLQSVKIILDKINRLYASMSEDPNGVSDGERDLMKEYILHLAREFKINLEKPDVVIAPIEVKHDAQKEVLVTISRPIQEIPPTQPDSQRLEPQKESFSFFVPHKHKPIEPIAVPEKHEVNNEDLRKIVEENVKKASNLLHDHPVGADYPLPLKKETFHVMPNGVSSKSDKNYFEAEKASSEVSEMDSIFELPADRNLAESLGDSPITDLNYALGVNEQAFTIHELFGGNEAEYAHTIEVLNRLPSFEEAKAYLRENIADKYHWTLSDKKLKAKIFVKMVRRRYQ